MTSATDLTDLTCSSCGDPIPVGALYHYNEDGEVTCQPCWVRQQIKEQAEDDLADRATDMPRWGND